MEEYVVCKPFIPCILLIHLFVPSINPTQTRAQYWILRGQKTAGRFTLDTVTHFAKQIQSDSQTG